MSKALYIGQKAVITRADGIAPPHRHVAGGEATAWHWMLSKSRPGEDLAAEDKVCTLFDSNRSVGIGGGISQVP